MNNSDEKEKYYDIWIEDGIVHIIYLYEQFTEEMVDSLIKQRLELTKDKSYPMFSDIRKTKSFTREARQRFAQKDAGYGTMVVAILINSKIQEIIYNFFSTVYKAPSPAKMFTDKEKSLKWLKQFKEKYEQKKIV